MATLPLEKGYRVLWSSSFRSGSFKMVKGVWRNTLEGGNHPSLMKSAAFPIDGYTRPKEGLPLPRQA